MKGSRKEKKRKEKKEEEKGRRERRRIRERLSVQTDCLFHMKIIHLRKIEMKYKNKMLQDHVFF